VRQEQNWLLQQGEPERCGEGWEDNGRLGPFVQACLKLGPSCPGGIPGASYNWGNGTVEAKLRCSGSISAQKAAPPLQLSS
jgi:hypothetical protein